MATSSNLSKWEKELTAEIAAEETDLSELLGILNELNEEPAVQEALPLFRHMEKEVQRIKTWIEQAEIPVKGKQKSAAITYTASDWLALSRYLWGDVVAYIGDEQIAKFEQEIAAKNTKTARLFTNVKQRVSTIERLLKESREKAQREFEEAAAEQARREYAQELSEAIKERDKSVKEGDDKVRELLKWLGTDLPRWPWEHDADDLIKAVSSLDKDLPSRGEAIPAGGPDLQRTLSASFARAIGRPMAKPPRGDNKALGKYVAELETSLAKRFTPQRSTTRSLVRRPASAELRVDEGRLRGWQEQLRDSAKAARAAIPQALERLAPEATALDEAKVQRIKLAISETLADLTAESEREGGPVRERFLKLMESLEQYIRELISALGMPVEANDVNVPGWARRELTVIEREQNAAALNRLETAVEELSDAFDKWNQQRPKWPVLERLAVSLEGIPDLVAQTETTMDEADFPEHRRATTPITGTKVFVQGLLDMIKAISSVSVINELREGRVTDRDLLALKARVWEVIGSRNIGDDGLLDKLIKHLPADLPRWAAGRAILFLLVLKAKLEQVGKDIDEMTEEVQVK